PDRTESRSAKVRYSTLQPCLMRIHYVRRLPRLAQPARYPLLAQARVRAARGQRGLDSLLDPRRLSGRHHPDPGPQDRGAAQAQEPGVEAGAGVGLREVHAQAPPRCWQAGRLPVRRVVQENHGLTKPSRTAAQMVSAETECCTAPG